MIWRTGLRSALITLLIGWVPALFFGGVVALLQRNAILAAFPGATSDTINAEIQSRLTRDLTASPLLLFVQIGITTGVLVWQVGKTARRMDDHRRAIQHGLVTGAILAVVQTVSAVFLQTPWIFTIPMIAVLLAAGMYGAWSALPPQGQTLDETTH